MPKQTYPEGCLGHVNDLTQEETAGMHIDGVSGLVFESEQAYLNFKHPEEVEVEPEE